MASSFHLSNVVALVELGRLGEPVGYSEIFLPSAM